MQTYINSDAFRHTARCDCGWDGARRWTRGSAGVDAALHEVGHRHDEDALLERQLLSMMELTAS